MKTKRKIMMVSVLVLGAFFLSAYATYAFGGPGWGSGGGHKLLQVIGLTDDQKQAIKTALESDTVLQGYKSQLKSAMPALFAARKKLKLEILEDIASGKPISTDSKIGTDQAAISNAEATVAPIRAEINLRVLEDIQTTLKGSLKLTPAQLSRLNMIIALLE